MAVKRIDLVTIPAGSLVWDFSYARPSVKELNANGVVAVARYVKRGDVSLVPDDGKYINIREAARYHAAGIAVIPIDELVADECVRGAGAGLTAGQGFVTGCRSLGVPKGCTIIGTNDTDKIDRAGISAIQAYNRAFFGQSTPAGYVPGLYAGSRQQWQVRDIVQVPSRPNASSWSPASIVMRWAMKQGWQSADHRYDPNTTYQPIVAWLPHDVVIPDPPIPPTPEVLDMHPVIIHVNGRDAQFTALAENATGQFFDVRWTGPGKHPRVAARLSAYVKVAKSVTVDPATIKLCVLDGPVPVESKYKWTLADFANPPVA